MTTTLTPSLRQTLLAEARKQLSKKPGTQLVSLSEDTAGEPVDVISTGSLLLDRALRIGGFPRGRMTELYGIQSSGKSTIALSAGVNAQKLNEGPVVYLDFEHTFSPDYARAIGLDLDPDKFLLSQPDTFESGMTVLEALVGLTPLVIVDSVAAMITKDELEGEVGDRHVAAQARAMAQELRRLTAKIASSNMAIIWLNHIRDSIGGARGFGPPPRTTPGGTALKFWASCRVELTPLESVRGTIEDPVSGAKVAGPLRRRVRAMVTKNKLGTPYRWGFFYVGAESGLDEARVVLDIALARGVAKKSGSRIVLPYFGDNAKPISLPGVESALFWLGNHPGEARDLRDMVLATLRKNVEPEASSEEELELPADDEVAGTAPLEPDSLLS